MEGRVTVVERRSLFRRAADSVVGALLGLILFVAAFPVLFWNEGRTLRAQESLGELRAAVVALPEPILLPENEGRPVHIVGEPQVLTPATDPLTGFSAAALRIEREAEMYQWEERTEKRTEKHLGGSETVTTTYSYVRVWRSHPIDSDGFHDPAGRRNPDSMPVRSDSFVADRVALGAFALPSEILDDLGETRRIEATPEMIAGLPADLRAKAQMSNGLIYVGADPSSPQIGDLRIGYRIAEPTTASLIGAQSNGGLAAWAAPAGDSLILAKNGSYGAEAMLTNAEEAETVLAWAIRGGGLLMMWFGLRMAVGPLAVVADVLPFLGSLVRSFTGAAAFLAALVLTLTTVALAWIAARPVLAAGLFAVAAVIAAFVLRRRAGLDAGRVGSVTAR